MQAQGERANSTQKGTRVTHGFEQALFAVNSAYTQIKN